MATRENKYAICVDNRGAEDLEVRKVYRVLNDRAASATGHIRVIDESGEDYVYPSGYFVAVELPRRAKQAWAAARSSPERRSAKNSLRQPYDRRLIASIDGSLPE